MAYVFGIRIVQRKHISDSEVKPFYLKISSNRDIGMNKSVPAVTNTTKQESEPRHCFDQRVKFPTGETVAVYHKEVHVSDRLMMSGVKHGTHSRF